MTWFIFAVLSAVLWGTENFLHKVSAERGYNSSKVSGILALTASIFSILFFFLFREQLINIQFLVIIAVLNSFTFFASFITRLEALRTIDASVFFPISRVGVLILVVLLSVFTLHETLLQVHWIGLVISVIAIYLLTSKSGEKSKKKTALYTRGFFFMCVSIVTAAFANYTADLAAAKTGPFAFSFLSYVIGIPVSFIIARTSFTNKENNDNASEKNSSGLYILAVIIGAFNFFGLVTFLLALKEGPLSIVGAINSFSVLLTIILSVVIYREQPTIKQTVGIVLAFIALLIFRL